MQEINVTEEEVKKISQLADSEGQVGGKRGKSNKTFFLLLTFPLKGCKNFRRAQVQFDLFVC